MIKYKNFEYEIWNVRPGLQKCRAMCKTGGTEFEAAHITDDMAKREIDRMIRRKEIEDYIDENSELCHRLWHTYKSVWAWDATRMYKIINRIYVHDHEKLTKKIFKLVSSRENKQLEKILSTLK